MPRFEPVDHDPFAAPRVAFMPVDNDPFMTSPEDAFAYGKGISPDATWRNLLPAAELGLSMAPGSGEAMSARDAWDASGRAAGALSEGNLGEAASEYLNMGTGLLGAIPGAGIVARGTKRGAAWMDRNLPEGFNRLLDAVYPSDPRNTTNIFAGPTAKTADHAALAKAQELTASGVSRDDIWQQTGWFQGVDGKWRFEIDDSGSRIVDPFESERITDAHIAASIDAKGRTGIPQSALNEEVFIHPELEAAYRDIPTGGYLFDNMGQTRGRYDPDNDIITLDSGASAFNPDQQRSTALHENQHAVQMREGFPRGANPETISKALQHLPVLEDANIIGRITMGFDGNVAKAEDHFVKVFGRKPLPRSQRIASERSLEDINSEIATLREYQNDPRFAYKHSAGEVEARNVQSRMNMTAAERRATPPWETQDVPDDQQIVRFR